ncbi:hypothetical protein M406DRAFT_255909, partial [Cryphonectria parasitica EP155]
LPEGSIVKSVYSHGLSAWSFTLRIETTKENGKPESFFAKYVAGDLGQQQLKGEYTGLTELYKLAPKLVVRPIAWGKLKNVEIASYFLLIEFRHLVTGLPDPAKLGLRLAEMHKRSESPTGMFGFGIQTYDGARLQSIAWDASWTSFFSNLLAEAKRQDTETNGVWPAMELVFARVQSHLIPRLIGALETHGNSIKPCLIHGDLWDGNVASDADSGDPIIFDCGVYYAHNEMELGSWRAERHRFRDKVFRREYLRHFQASKPEEEWDDRNRLYSAKTNLMHSACYAGSPARQLAFDDFVHLIQKYAPFEDGSQDWKRVQDNIAGSPRIE